MQKSACLTMHKIIVILFSNSLFSYSSIKKTGSKYWLPFLVSLIMTLYLSVPTCGQYLFFLFLSAPLFLFPSRSVCLPFSFGSEPPPPLVKPMHLNPVSNHCGQRPRGPVYAPGRSFQKFYYLWLK